MTENVQSGRSRSERADTGAGHCMGCGEAVPEREEACPACGAEHLPPERLESLGETAEKDRDWGVDWVQAVPIVLPVVLWRQTRIEGAQRDLIHYRSQFDDVEAVHCRACGEAVDREAAECGACGYRNVAATIDEMTFDVHDPGEHETDRSKRWWVGPVLGPPAGLLGFLVVGPLGLNGLELHALFGGALAAAIGGFFDRQYVRANAPWSPTYALLVGLLVPFLNLGLAYYYGHKRLQTLGRDEFW